MITIESSDKPRSNSIDNGENRKPVFGGVGFGNIFNQELKMRQSKSQHQDVPPEVFLNRSLPIAPRAKPPPVAPKPSKKLYISDLQQTITHQPRPAPTPGRSLPLPNMTLPKPQHQPATLLSSRTKKQPSSEENSEVKTTDPLFHPTKSRPRPQRKTGAILPENSSENPKDPINRVNKDNRDVQTSPVVQPLAVLSNQPSTVNENGMKKLRVSKYEVGPIPEFRPKAEAETKEMEENVNSASRYLPLIQSMHTEVLKENESLRKESPSVPNAKHDVTAAELLIESPIQSQIHVNRQSSFKSKNVEFLMKSKPTDNQDSSCSYPVLLPATNKATSLSNSDAFKVDTSIQKSPENTIFKTEPAKCDETSINQSHILTEKHSAFSEKVSRNVEKSIRLSEEKHKATLSDASKIEQLEEKIVKIETEFKEKTASSIKKISNLEKNVSDLQRLLDVAITKIDKLSNELADQKRSRANSSVKLGNDLQTLV